MNDPQAVRVRLEEVLHEVRALDSQLVEPLSLQDSIDELETTITVYESFENSEYN